MKPALTDQDIATIATVSQAMSLGFIRAGGEILTPFANDPAISPLGLLLGVAQSHLDGLASSLATLEPATRDHIIASVPAQLHRIIGRAGQ